MRHEQNKEFNAENGAPPDCVAARPRAPAWFSRPLLAPKRTPGRTGGRLSTSREAVPGLRGDMHGAVWGGGGRGEASVFLAPLRESVKGGAGETSRWITARSRRDARRRNTPPRLPEGPPAPAPLRARSPFLTSRQLARTVILDLVFMEK